MTEGWLIVRIAEKWPDSEDTFGLTLMSVDGSALPAFAAGDHIDVRIADGLVRQYSLFGSPRNLTQYRICVQRASPSRGGSAFIADNFRAGDLIRISRPRSCFLIAEDAAFHVLVAGGIGITPIIAMAEQLILDGKSFHLHYCCRSRARTPLLGLLEQERFTGRFDLHLSEGPSASRLDLDRLVAQSPPGSHIYVCGPHRLIEAACGAAKSRGWDAARVHHEEFSPTPATHYGEAFRIRLARSGLELDVPPENSIAEVLHSNGVNVELSCEQGLCGTCAVKVLEGIPDHRDVYLNTSERASNATMLVCCSRSRTSTLVLDC